MNPFKSIRAAVGSAGDEAYECRTCGASFGVQYHVCPDCDGFSVEASAGRWEDVDRPVRADGGVRTHR